MTKIRSGPPSEADMHLMAHLQIWREGTMTQGELLRFIGGTLYGANAPWGTRMADDLRVNRRTIGRWLDGSEIMPAGVWHELDLTLLARLPDIEIARGHIAKFIKPAPRKETADG